MRVNTLSTVVATVAMACSGLAADWPQFLGPDRDSTSPEKGLLRSWPESGPEVLWTVALNRGYAGPVVKDGRVYLLDRNAGVGDNLRAFDLSTGEELWNFAYEAPGSVMFPGSRSVPTVDGEYIYSVGHSGDLYAIHRVTGKPLWNKNVWKDFGGDELPIWGVTQCPLVYGDLLIVASQAPEAGVVAYEKLTGAMKWKTPSLGYVGYVSPAVVKVDGDDHVVMVTPSTNPFRRSSPDENKMGTIVGIEPLTGKILWEYDNWNCHISVAPAVDAGENRILVVGGYELGAKMIEVEKREDGSYGATELFTTEEFGGHTKRPILYEGFFYAQYSTNSRRDGLVCMGMDGTIQWKTRRSPDFNKGSMILADGLILATDGAKSLYLIEPDPSGFKPLASAELLGEKGTESEGIARRVGGSIQNWAPIALSDGKLLIRDHSKMMCLKVAE
jgi:outer membrane protein assembly factor BamB